MFTAGLSAALDPFGLKPVANYQVEQVRHHGKSRNTNWQMKGWLKTNLNNYFHPFTGHFAQLAAFTCPHKAFSRSFVNPNDLANLLTICKPTCCLTSPLTRIETSIQTWAKSVQTSLMHTACLAASKKPQYKRLWLDPAKIQASMLVCQNLLRPVLRAVRSKMICTWSR